ncbi:MAG: fibronectin type III domain-containing protein, partial [Bacteroidota bacterium]
MKIFMRLTLSLLLFALSFSSASNAQSILNPADPVVTYNSATPPTEPPFGQIGKWVRTVRLGWNTTPYKAYIYKGIAFRLKFPKTYNPTVVDGKKYPMMVFFHGLGEAGQKTDNEYQLYHGGDYFRVSVDDGTYDGYVLFLQSTGFWGPGYYELVREIIDYMVVNNKLDAFRVTDNGLSAGGSATWEMFLNHPAYIAAALPMSAVAIGYKDAPVVDKVKFTPFWNIHGGLDGSPAPSTAEQVRDAMLAAGGNYKNLMYPNLGHGTWNQTWNEPDFWPFMLRAYAANPWPLFGRTEFCPNETINVTIGLAPGFDEYQWRKDGVALTSTVNTIQATATGLYDARVRRGTLWSEWSKTPVHIKIKTATVTPNITVSGAGSRVLPSLDGSSTVKLEVPAGFISYDWQGEGNPTTISTTRFLTVAQPGSYKVKVTEQFGCSSNFSQLFKVIDANGNTKPEAATNVLASTASKTAIRLDWNSNPTPQENEIGFEIYQSTQTGGPYQFVGVTGADVNTFTVNSLNPNTTYFFKVRAVGNFGASSASNEASAKTFSDNIAPTAPANLRIVDVTQNSVSLAWTASTDDVGTTKYEIYINGVKSYITTETQFLVSGLETNTSYVFKIIARDFAGNSSPFSNQLSVTPRFGLNFKYYTYSGSWSALPNFNNLTPASTGRMQNVLIANRTQDDRFAYLWEGYIKIPVGGTYYFRTNSDDGSKLYLGALGGTTSPYNFSASAVVNNDGLHAAQDATSAPVNLAAGVYPIAITFYEEGGAEVMTASWKTPETSNTFVPIPNIAFCDQPTSITLLGKPTNFNALPASYQRIDLTWMDNSNNETGFEISRSTSAFTNFAVIKT